MYKTKADIEERVFVCKCSSMEHILIASWFPNETKDKSVYVSIHLKNDGLFQRIKQAIKHIFGYKCKYGNFEEVILGEKHIPQLKEIISYLEKKN